MTDALKKPAFSPEGVLLLDYLALHAPPVPDWFIHKSSSPEPTKPMTLPFVFGENSNHPHRVLIKKYWSDDGFTEDANEAMSRPLQEEITKEIKEWSDKWDNHILDHAAWLQKDNFEKATQWAYAYAMYVDTARKNVLAKIDEENMPGRSEYDKSTSTKHNSICLLRAGDDEPIFVLRAKDPTAPHIVREWCAANNDLQPIEKVGGAMILADKMEEWRKENVKE